MSRNAVFPGSFDPFTIGHLALLKRAVLLFDKVTVAIGVNTQKKCFMSAEQRLATIMAATRGMATVDVLTYSGLTTDLCHELGANYIVRGVRNTTDFDYERTVADNNRLIAPDIETVLLIAEPQYAVISSTLVRELAAFGKDYSRYVVDV